MRITDDMRFGIAMQNQAKVSERLQELSKQAATGERVSAPSDDPVAYGQKLRHDADLALAEARKTTVDRGADLLAVGESSLASAADHVHRARTLALQMANGSVDAQTRAAAAQEIAAIRSALLGLANTQVSGNYVFGGTATGGAPFTSAGVFTGNDNAIQVDVANGVSIRTNPSGATAFTTAGGRDVFVALQSLERALALNNVAGIQTSAGEMEDSYEQITGARTDTGFAMQRLRSASEVMDAARTRAEEARAAVTEADAVETYSGLMSAESAYEQSLAVTKRLLALSSSDRF